MDKKEQFNFGFKSRRPGKAEEEMKFEFPYVEIIPAKGKGSVTKFRLLNGAAELLELVDEKDNKVSYFQNDEDNDRFFLANTSKLDKNSSECKVNLDNSFNSKTLHKRMCEEWDLDLTEVIYFQIGENEVKGYEGLHIVEFLDSETARDVTISGDDKVVAADEPPFVPIDPDSDIPEV